jgi:uncharacterized protein (TIGR02757 family)
VLKKQHTDLKAFLDAKATQFNVVDFIQDDPITIPHRFTKKQDIEIAGLFAAILAWGNRKSIINSCNTLLKLMDNDPYNYIMALPAQQNEKTFAPLKKFVHRTFNALDLWHLLYFLRHHYHQQKQHSLETAFTQWMQPGDTTVENALAGFHNYVFGYDGDAIDEKHCRKHIATPAKKSACKRLNMYLRWMVRSDKNRVDFGIWKNISPAQLVCPLDVHVARVARRLGLLLRTQDDWPAAMELTQHLRTLDAADPVKYDFALFGLGVVEKF